MNCKLSFFPEVCSAITSCEIAEDVSWSPLWNCDVRKNVKDSKQPDSEINALRSRLLVPGELAILLLLS